jgi:HSP20 family protein
MIDIGDKTMTFYLHPYPYHRAARRAENRDHVLRVNILEEDEAYVLSALVPGIKAEDLNIQVLEDVVRIEGEYKPNETEYLMQELPNGSFARTLRLPAIIDADHVEARITDGILTLKLPKEESARPKKISIKSR